MYGSIDSPCVHPTTKHKAWDTSWRLWTLRFHIVVDILRTQSKGPMSTRLQPLTPATRSRSLLSNSITSTSWSSSSAAAPQLLLSGPVHPSDPENVLIPDFAQSAQRGLLRLRGSIKTFRLSLHCEQGRLCRPPPHPDFLPACLNFLWRPLASSCAASITAQWTRVIQSGSSLGARATNSL